MLIILLGTLERLLSAFTDEIVLSFLCLTWHFTFLVTRRLKSIKNIQKITKSMKMVAAAKYARAERELKPARVYGTGSLGELGRVCHERWCAHSESSAGWFGPLSKA